MAATCDVKIRLDKKLTKMALLKHTDIHTRLPVFLKTFQIANSYKKINYAMDSLQIQSSTELALLKWKYFSNLL